MFSPRSGQARPNALLTSAPRPVRLVCAAMAEFKEGERINVRGHKLYTVNYYPKEAQPRAALVFHHGLAEHVGRYTEIFTTLASSGIAVYSGDAFGHGKSEGERAFIESFDGVVADFAAYCDYARDDVTQRYHHAPPPMFIGGHSLGGLVAALTCLQDQSRWAGLLLLSPALDVEWSLSLRIQAALGNILAHLLPRARIVKAVRPEDMNADPACVEQYLSDPLNTVGPLATRTANETMAAFKKLRPQYGAFTLPIYAHHGEVDKCTSLPATRRFVEAAASKDKTFRVISGGYHEVMMGPGKEEVVSKMADWILQHAGPAQKL